MVATQTILVMLVIPATETMYLIPAILAIAVILATTATHAVISADLLTDPIRC